METSINVLSRKFQFKMTHYFVGCLCSASSLGKESQNICPLADKAPNSTSQIRV